MVDVVASPQKEIEMNRWTLFRIICRAGLKEVVNGIKRAMQTQDDIEGWRIGFLLLLLILGVFIITILSIITYFIPNTLERGDIGLIVSLMGFIIALIVGLKIQDYFDKDNVS